MRLKNICFIADGYPSEHRVVNTFVENLVNAIADAGVNCVVISPQSINKAMKIGTQLLPSKRIRKTPGGNAVTVYTPKYFSASSKKIGFINTAKVTLASFRRAAVSKFKQIHKSTPIDAVYGHFIFESGITANFIGKRYNVPAFLAYGENGTYSIEYLGEKTTKEFLQGISGVISVSSRNKQNLVEREIIDEERIEVFPNAINAHLFYKKTTEEVRKKLGFPKDAFIVAFVGRFLEVKGPERLSAAIKMINDDEIFTIFIGDGDQQPSCNNILFKGSIQNNQMIDYLNAADVFVLPTLAEGCCNAIIEAMACGLPIVSSNLEFNDDILDETCSIRIDTNNVRELADAIFKLKSDPLIREALANGALKKAAQLTIDKRAEKILAYMDKMI